jgi:hypothetical protein
VYVTKQGGGFGMQELTFVDLTKEIFMVMINGGHQ